MNYSKLAFILGFLGLAVGASCKTYDPSLVGSGGSAGNSGGGGATACSAASECPGMDDECKKRACKGGVCGFDFTAKDTKVATQTAHDCKTVVCNGQGSMEAAPDPGDPPDDMLECTVDSCAMSVPMSAPKMAGTPCSQGGGKVCNDTSACVECVVNNDCMSKVCNVATFKCSPPGCGDMAQNGGETDVDCGATCPPCALGKKCGGNMDCVGQNCVGGTCQPSCSDGTLNNGESDVDCGGPTCGKCPLGKKCGGDADCASNHCAGGVCYLDHLVINEVDYDNPSTDTAEFVEIYNGTGVPVDLNGYVLDLINGATSLTYLSYDLSPAGMLAPGQYLVVGSMTVTAGLPAQVLKLNFAAASNNIQNGSPDGVALIDTTAGKLVDALSYEGSMTMVTATGLPTMVSLVEGTALAANVADSDNSQGSLCRIPSGRDTDNAATDWNNSGTLTPGAANVP